MALKWRMVWMAGPGMTSFGPSVGVADSGQVIELSEGQVLTVELPRGDLGMQWRVQSSLASGVLELEREPKHPERMSVFEFRALRPGNVALALEPRLRLAHAPASAFQLTVQVR